MKQNPIQSYWGMIWQQFKHHRLGMIGLLIVGLFCLAGIYAPFLASSKPIAVEYNGQWFFPLFKYLLYSEFYTKRLDIFFNLLSLTFPFFVLILYFGGKYRWSLFALLSVFQMGVFLYFGYGTPKDPAANLSLKIQQQHFFESNPSSTMSWQQELAFMTPYEKLNLVLRYRLRKQQQEKFQQYEAFYVEHHKTTLPTLWQIDENHRQQEIQQQTSIIEHTQDPKKRAVAQAKLNLIQDRQQWLQEENKKINHIIMPLIRPFHWEDDAGGSQSLNQFVDWWDLTRINRKDLVAALIFGIRISLVVGLMAVGLSLLIGIPVGAFAGFYGGTIDIIASRLLEIWESMPTFFMLLMVVAVTQSKSIFLVIAVIGFFGWTGFSRYIRGEFFKQRNLAYVEACRSLGFNDRYVMFYQILPNAIPPLLTLLPFAIMGAISSEAGLSFLGLGEEGSCSWGVLMDEGRTAFPGEAYLLWPPAILLTILLVAIALVGDALRDALDPKLA